MSVRSPTPRAPSLPLFAAVCLGAASALAASPRGQEPDAAGLEFFETRIRPLLAERCASCHGDEKQRSDLRVDSREALLLGGERGPALVPGEPDASAIIVAVRYDDEELQMPPKGKLEEAEIELLEHWVAMGAPAPAGEMVAAVAGDEFDLEARLQHWSLQPLADPEAPAAGGARTPIDAFLDARREGAGLTVAGAAPPLVQLRRLSYDVIGLPPSLAELEAFEAALARDGLDAAYAAALDRLLDSPHFGERWGRHWLDLVRYAESRGHEFDYELPNAWQYRDYVIRALNADVPYDRFLVEHVAGDLVETPRRNPERGWDESALGTGFWFLGESVHSPVDIRGDEIERVANQVDVFSKTFLGLTVACARCHDHKFDAIPTVDYYALTGYLASSNSRQLRFESLERNSRVARELPAMRAEFASPIATAAGEALRRDLEGFDELLLAARDYLRSERELANVEPDVLFADFEGEDFGGWSAEGTSFVDGPTPVVPTPGGLQRSGALGERLADSHRALSGQGPLAGEAFTGTLTSPAFTVERDYVNLLVGGGNQAGRTCVQLLVEGEVVDEATGQADRRMRTANLDARAVRGREARLRVVDLAAGDWGSIAIDQVVFSNRPTDASFVEDPEQRSTRLAAAAAARAEEAARAIGRPSEVLRSCLDEIEAARGDAGSPLHAWAWLACTFDDERPWQQRRDEYLAARRAPATTAAENTQLVFDYAEARPGDWIQDGVSFGFGPLRRGVPHLTPELEWPIEGVAVRDAARKDPAFDLLELAPGTTRESWRFEWVQAGRTLFTPTFELSQPRLHYLVRGGGRAHAEVNSHRMNQGPLHAALARSWDAAPSGGYRWIEHDLSNYVGHRLTVEFSPAPPTGKRAARFEVVRVVQSSGPPPDLARAPEALLARIERSAAAEDLAALIEARLRAAAAALEGGELYAAPGADDLAVVADWLVARPALFVGEDSRKRMRALSERYVKRENALRGDVHLVSHTAPAMLDGTGWDEAVLIRGSHRSPGETAWRAPPVALGGASEPAPDSGSGRLELAQRLVDSTRSPIVPRVLVNRVWHHLFGRGLVASVDDFGVMGELPSHPELLDWLARRFVEEDEWSLKRLVRRVVSSDAYRRASPPPPDARERDPNDLLLAHARVRRLEGEALRDAILFVSGSLDPTIGGASVPIHLTPYMQGRGKPGQSGPLDGRGRRSIYLSVRRNFLVPMLLAFDFPQPATTRGRRGASNVPAQALTLLNDPFVLEAAQRWASRLPELSDAQRVERMYLQAFTRQPSDAESRAALEFLAAAPEGQAGWTELAHVLFNVKEFIFLD